MVIDAGRVEEIRVKHDALAPVLDERRLRLWAASEAKALGRGGIAAVTAATGIRGKRIAIGIRELVELEEEPPTLPARRQRIRRRGAGRKALAAADATLWSDLEALLDPVTRGDPESPLRWTSKGTRALAEQLRESGHRVSARTVAKLLHEHGYSLQGTRKTIEGRQHPDRNAQFEHINRQTKAFHAAGHPVISVDTKKKELVGEFANKGREWQPAGEPTKVQVHDFPSDAVGKAIPYGVYDVGRNEGWVSVGVDHDTAAFAVASIRAWWNTMGKRAYGSARELYIVADAGGSNAYRNRLWKAELQKFADDAGLELSISHMPPGTSKWNKIEHRLFSHISQNWRGRPLVDHETIVSLIANTTTATGLKVKARLDRRQYRTKVKVPNAVMRALAIVPRRFHGEWNYKINSRDHA
ncbi:MAG TPA: ISAzo13 family transposase [Polyangiaceae bacterium]|jgi:transposase|nr:ISAzo13 family transposase [Polyangiaceae bacterium]